MPRRSGYHHGDLREELLRLGMESIEAHGTEGLSLRALAHQAGVSKTAPYRHFADRDALLAAIAEEGFRELTEALSAARDRRAASTRETLAEMGSAYLQFALQRPQLYRLMFSPILECIPDEEIYWARRALETLAEVVTNSAATRQTTGDRDRADGDRDGAGADAIAAAWGYIHGVVMLRLDGLYPPHFQQPDWEALARLVPQIPSEAGDR